MASAVGQPAAPEYNPLRHSSIVLGPQASRFIVGFKATASNAVVVPLVTRRAARRMPLQQAQTVAADLEGVAARAGIRIAKARQLTPAMHVVQLDHTLYGADVESALAQLRADPAVEFADVDQRRFAHAAPNDPLYAPSSGASGQWYMLTPSTLTPTSDAAATDAISAWGITTGSSSTVIADIDTGILFDHPDLLRAGFGGRVLPGYDFVGQDYNATTSAPLGTYLIANDGDGWDPDPSDPGDWLTATDENNALFPAASCGSPADSSWHGTRVMGILGALTNNAMGIAGMTWKPYLLPVRALGKCGGYDSDIITGMQWAAGLPVTGVATNPYPADIVNLSLGGSGTCSSAYAAAVTSLTQLGVLIVASAGNESGPVDAPGNCPGVLAVAGLRNIGTKVGYSSLGAEVSVAAPAGNCVNSSGACLKSIDTTSNAGLTIPAANIYTNETNPNLGTSFSAPIVAGIAALMESVNANLTPAQLITRIKASSSPFPQIPGVAVCGSAASDSTSECVCPNNGTECGAGMVNAFKAVVAAQRPIAAIAIPAVVAAGGSGTLDAGGSVAACNRTIAGYAWTATGGVTVQSGAASSSAGIVTSGTAGTVTLTVTDSTGAVDTAVVTVGASSASTSAPASGGSAASACLADMTVNVAAPVINAAFAPTSVATNVASTLTVTLQNANGFALTQASVTETLPAQLSIVSATAAGVMPAVPAPSTTCGAGATLVSTTTSVSLSGAIIPANGSCAITLPVASATPATYTNTIAVGALTTVTAGGNAAADSTSLTVTAPSKSGGGEVDIWDTMFVIGVLLAGRRQLGRRRP